MAISHEPRGRWACNMLADFERDLAGNLCYWRGTTAGSASAQDACWTMAVTVRDRLTDLRARTARASYVADPKFVYCLSAGYVLECQLRQNALSTGPAGIARGAVAAAGFSAGELESLVMEPGLGNGNLDRLAVCLLVSMAILDTSAVAYGIWCEFGVFKQALEDGRQVEHPDDWTFYGNPWEFPAPGGLRVVWSYGRTEAVDGNRGGGGPAGCRVRRWAASRATCWSRVMAPRQSALSGCGTPGPAGSRSAYMARRIGLP